MPAPQRGAFIVLYTQTGIVQLLEYSCEIANLSTGILILLPATYASVVRLTTSRLLNLKAARVLHKKHRSALSLYTLAW